MLMKLADMDYNESEILSLPVEDTVWLLEVTQRESQSGTNNLTIVDKRAVVIGYQEFPETYVISRQDVYKCVCSSMLYPKAGKPRRPRYFTFKDPTLAGDFNINLDHLGILSLSDKYSRELTKHLVFRQCSNCNIRATKEFFLICPNCNAALFCCEKCCISDQSHLEWCHSIMEYMSESKALMDLPFSFASETTSADFDVAAYKKFLEKRGVYNQGSWRREIVSPSTQGLSYGCFVDDPESFVLPVEDSILEEPFCPCEPITDWESYYKQRKINFDSPVAVLLQWPLTLYWILTTCLPKHYKLFLTDQETTVIDMIGVEREVDIFHVFKELGFLVPGTQFHIRMFGRKIEKTLNNKNLMAGNVKITFYRKLYHKVKGHDKPDIVIGFNAGLAAYPSWIKTLCLLKKHNIPSYFTDYCRQSIDMARRCLTREVGYTFNSSSRLASLSSSETTIRTDAESKTHMTQTLLVSSLLKTSNVTSDNLVDKCKHDNSGCEVEAKDLTKTSETSMIGSSTDDVIHNKNSHDTGSTTDNFSDVHLTDVNFSEAVINPFRGPIRLFCEDHNMPWFSNAFVFHLVYN